MRLPLGKRLIARIGAKRSDIEFGAPPDAEGGMIDKYSRKWPQKFNAFCDLWESKDGDDWLLLDEEFDPFLTLKENHRGRPS